jgi:hypothetical protein
MIFRLSYNRYESVASLPDLAEYGIAFPVSNIVPSSNDVITNRIFMAFRREHRDVQVIRELNVQRRAKPCEIETRVIQSDVYIKPLSYGFVEIVTRQILLTN